MNPGLLPFDDALAALLGQAVPIDGVERVDTLEAGGRVLAEDIRSALAVPSMDNAQMDGYALRSADLEGATEASPVRLRDFSFRRRIDASTLRYRRDCVPVTVIVTGFSCPFASR